MPKINMYGHSRFKTGTLIKPKFSWVFLERVLLSQFKSRDSVHEDSGTALRIGAARA